MIGVNDSNHSDNRTKFNFKFFREVKPNFNLNAGTVEEPLPRMMGMSLVRQMWLKIQNCFCCTARNHFHYIPKIDLLFPYQTLEW